MIGRYRARVVALVAMVAMVVLAGTSAEPWAGTTQAQTQVQAGEQAFPETGFSVRGPFLAYWQANGGLAQQGLPISPELTEGGLTVQYFERARFERHPEFQGTPYEVLLGLLGRDAYAQRYPTGVYAPAPISPNAIPGGEGRVFAQTGFRTPGLFLSAWECCGGLAQQGYPVSPVFREGAYLVQYFERARFEWHPEYAGAGSEVLLGLLGRSAYSRAHAVSQAPVTVTTSLSIFADYISRVGGDRVQVTALLGPDTDPHDFEPTPQDAVTVSQSRAFFANGVGLEAWLTDTIKNAANPALQVVTLSDGLPLLGKNRANPEFKDGNPHLWLDVTNAMAYVMRIRDTLDDLDPANSPLYDADAARYLALLRDLDAAISTQITSLPPAKRKMVTFHDAWPYFSQRYSLQNFPVHQSNPEGEISAQEYAEIVDLIRREHVTVIFGEAGFNPKVLQQLARDTGVTFIDGLYGDTLAPSGPASTYVGMMQHDISLMVDVLK